MKTVLKILLPLALFLRGCEPCPAADGSGQQELMALAELESGNNDLAVGKAGERSRYQISPRVVREFGLDAERLHEADYARAAAQRIMDRRTKRFLAKHRTDRITPEQWALLWHCPARVNRPNAEARDYAQRFENLFNAKVAKKAK